MRTASMLLLSLFLLSSLGCQKKEAKFLKVVHTFLLDNDTDKALSTCVGDLATILKKQGRTPWRSFKFLSLEQKTPASPATLTGLVARDGAPKPIRFLLVKEGEAWKIHTWYRKKKGDWRDVGIRLRLQARSAATAAREKAARQRSQKVLGSSTVRGLQVTMGRGKKGIWGEVLFFRFTTPPGKELSLKKVEFVGEKLGIETSRKPKETQVRMFFKATQKVPYRTTLKVHIGEKGEDSKQDRLFVFKDIPIE